LSIGVIDIYLRSEMGHMQINSFDKFVGLINSFRISGFNPNRADKKSLVITLLLNENLQFKFAKGKDISV
jgi:hypothetical protein